MKEETCNYCSNRAKHNLVFLKNPDGSDARIVKPHCGCDFMATIRRMTPLPQFQAPLREGTDYLIEPLPEDMYHKVSGDRVNVTIQIRDPQGIFVRHTIPKMAARKLAKDVQAASQLPDPGCNDAEDHWRGHCGCK